MAIDSSDLQLLAQDIWKYRQLAYRDHKLIHNTPVVMNLSLDQMSETGTREGHSGKIRVLNYDDVTYNVGDETDTDATFSEMTSSNMTYVKCNRNIAYQEYLISEMLSGLNGFERVTALMGSRIAKDRTDAINAVLNAVAVTEALRGGSGSAQSDYGQTDPDAEEKTNGFFVDFGNTEFQKIGGSSGQLVDLSQDKRGNALGGLIAAASTGFKDYSITEPLYLICPQSQYVKLQRTSVVDEMPIEMNGVRFMSMMGGWLRVISISNAYRNVSSATRVTAASGSGNNAIAASDKTAFLCREGAIMMAELPTKRPIAFDNDESKGSGAGIDEMYSRWTYMVHPDAYSFKSATINKYVANNGANTLSLNNNAASLTTNWSAVKANKYKKILPLFFA